MLFRILALTAVLALVSGCNDKDAESQGTAPAAATAASAPAPAAEAAAAPGDTAKKGEDGAGCLAASDCESGVCEGEGCGDIKGRCMSRARPCTLDLAPFCGCDGEDFQASGSCPGRRYAHRGPCEAEAATKGEDGAGCLEASDCESGVCEGEGCGDIKGRCMPKLRPCTRDLALFCGCDGKEFQNSGSCPGRRYARRGPCEAAPAP